MREAQNGFSMDTRSLNGNGRARCFGFMVNVCAPPFHFCVSNEYLALQRGQERPFFRMRYSIPTILHDLLTCLSSSSIIGETMRMRDSGLASGAHFYFDFRDSSKQNDRGVLCSLLTQLSAESDACCCVLERLYSAHQAGATEPSKDALKGCLKSMLMPEDQGPIFIILDAIDECPNSAGTPSPRENVLELVEWLSELQYSHLSICITSRPEADIEEALLPLATHVVSLHDERGQKEDIVNYIKWFINSDRKTRKWRKEDKEFVFKRLSEGADGM